MHISIQEVHVQRVNIVTTEPFDTVVARIDAQIGHPDMAASFCFPAAKMASRLYVRQVPFPVAYRVFRKATRSSLSCWLRFRLKRVS